MNTVEKRSSRDAGSKTQFERMVESNTKLVDEIGELKKDMKILVRFMLYPDNIDEDSVDRIIEYYAKKLNIVNDTESRGD